MRTFALLLALSLPALRAQTPSTNLTSATTTHLTANTAAQPNRQITLAEAIQLALQKNLDIAIFRYNPEISQYALSASFAVYEPSARLGAVRTVTQTPSGGFDEQGRPIPSIVITEDDYTAGIGQSVQGYTPIGMTYSIGGTLSKQNRKTEGFLGTDTHSGGANISISQPLLRNAWIDEPRAQIQINRRNVRISEEQLRQQMNLTLLNVEVTYYNLIFARENVRVQSTALDLASQLLRENRKRVEVGALAPLDEKQAESEVASTRAALIDAERSLSEQQNLLKALITDNYAEWNGVNLEPVENLVAIPANIDLHQSWGRALNQRPDLVQLKYQLEIAGVTLKLRKNQLWPELDVFGSYGHSEIAGADGNFQDVLGDLPTGRNPNYRFGVVLDIPLGNRGARARYKSAKADSAQSLLEYKRLEQQIMVQIDDAVKAIRSTFERVEATRAARAFAQEALAAEQKKLENGKSTSFFVLQFQRDLTVRRFDEIRALAEYNNALALLANREGATLERHSIQFTTK